MNSIDLSNLLSSETPHLHSYEGDVDKLEKCLSGINFTSTRADLCAVQSYDDFFRVMKATFEYPEWFGNNANALWDMLTGYGEPKKNNVLIFENVDELFKNSPKVLDLLLEYYKDAAVYWAIPNSSIGQEHGSVALNVILHTRVYDLAYDQYAAKKLGAMYIDRLTASAA